MKLIFYTIHKSILVILILISVGANAQNTDKTFYKTALSLFKEGQYTKALKDFDQISDVYKNSHPEVTYYKVYALVQVGELHKASAFINTHKEEIPTPNKEKPLPEIIAFLNTALQKYAEYVTQSDNALNNKKNEDALQLINKAMELDSFYLYGYNKRAFINIRLHRFDACIKDCNTVLTSAPADAAANYYKGIALYNLKEYKSAIECYSKSIQEDPYADAYYERGIAYYYMEDYEKSFEDANKVIELDNTFESAYYLRGILNQKRSMYKNALKDFDNSIRLGRASAEVFLFKGECLYFLDKDSLALVSIDKALSIDNKSAYANYYKARCIVSMGDYYQDETHIKAFNYFDLAIKLDSTNSDFFYYRGVSKKMCDRYDAAIKDIATAIRINDLIFAYYDEQNTCHELKGSLFRIRKKDLYIGINAYKKDIKNNSKSDNQSYFNMSKCYDLIWSFTKDKAYLDTTFQILNTYITANPKDAEAYFERGMLWYTSIYNYEKAIEDLSTSLRYDSVNYTAYVNLGWAYMHSDKPKQAYEIFLIMRRRYPKSYDVIDPYIAEAKKRMLKK